MRESSKILFWRKVFIYTAKINDFTPSKRYCVKVIIITIVFIINVIYTTKEIKSLEINNVSGRCVTDYECIKSKTGILWIENLYWENCNNSSGLIWQFTLWKDWIFLYFMISLYFPCVYITHKCLDWVINNTNFCLSVCLSVRSSVCASEIFCPGHNFVLHEWISI